MYQVLLSYRFNRLPLLQLMKTEVIKKVFNSEGKIKSDDTNVGKTNKLNEPNAFLL